MNQTQQIGLAGYPHSIAQFNLNQKVMTGQQDFSFTSRFPLNARAQVLERS